MNADVSAPKPAGSLHLTNKLNTIGKNKSPKPRAKNLQSITSDKKQKLPNVKQETKLFLKKELYGNKPNTKH